MKMTVSADEQMQYQPQNDDSLSEAFNKAIEKLRKEHEAEIRHSEEAQAEKLKRLTAKPLTQYSQPKPQPEKLCSCPLHCDTKFSHEQKKSLYEQFRDKFTHPQQNKYIRRHLKIRRGQGDKGKRISCIYLVPTIGSAKESDRHAGTLSYDTYTDFLDTSVTHRNGLRPTIHTIRNEPDTGSYSPKDESTSELSTSIALASISSPEINGVLDLSPPGRRTENGNNSEMANSPASLNDDDNGGSVKSADAETDTVCDFSDVDSAIDYSSRVRYVGVCQKAFMNMYGITEKRIRWQRSKLLENSEIKSQVLAEERLEEDKERRKEAEEKDRDLSVAHSLGEGCKPLYDLMEKTNCSHMMGQLVLAIVDDVDLVNNFFRNQLWELEDMADVTADLTSSLSMETESDQMEL